VATINSFCERWFSVFGIPSLRQKEKTKKEQNKTSNLYFILIKFKAWERESRFHAMID
jgi:hypothetical protein